MYVMLFLKTAPHASYLSLVNVTNTYVTFLAVNKGVIGI